MNDEERFHVKEMTLMMEVMTRYEKALMMIAENASGAAQETAQQVLDDTRAYFQERHEFSPNLTKRLEGEK